MQEEEAKASKKANFAGAIAADAQRDLDEALPTLDAALTSLKSLNKNDVTEVRGSGARRHLNTTVRVYMRNIISPVFHFHRCEACSDRPKG